MNTRELEEAIAGGKRILLVGIGNVLRRDDGIGVYIVQRIKESAWLSGLVVEVSLENYIRVINRKAPDLLILVDCLDFGKWPGYSRVLSLEQIREDAVHSHHLTLSKVSEYFAMPVRVLGIQPGSIKVGEEMTPAVRDSGNRLIRFFHALAGTCSPVNVQ